MIEATGISVTIDRHSILHNVDLRALPGEITVIVGPNGSGKSTLLKAICGDLAHAGAVSINGRPTASMKAWEAASLRAVLPQSTVLSFPFTVREVVKIGMTAGRSGARLDELDRLPELALQRVDLAGYSGRFYSELSGGEQQRVQLARTLCQVWTPTLDGQPRYLLLDEPVSSLDVRHQIAVMQVARTFAAAGGGVVAILHDLNLTAMFADRVLVLSGGRVHDFGRPAEAITDGMLREVFEVALRVGATPVGDVPFVLPQSMVR